MIGSSTLGSAAILDSIVNSATVYTGYLSVLHAAQTAPVHTTLCYGCTALT
jgi:hypothetical protein